METEKIAVFSEKGAFLNVATRQEVHEKGYWHETFHCWFVSRKSGRDVIHLQLRSSGKKDFPDMLDITAAGHLLADETVKDGIREVEEELGIALSFGELVPLGIVKDQIHQNEFLDNERCHVFLYKAKENIDAAYVLQKEEVAGMAMMDFQKFYDFCRNLEQEVDVEGFVIAEDGQKVPLKKSITQKDLVPHSSAYLKQVTNSIQEELSR